MRVENLAERPRVRRGEERVVDADVLRALGDLDGRRGVVVDDVRVRVEGGVRGGGSRGRVRVRRGGPRAAVRAPPPGDERRAGAEARRAASAVSGGGGGRGDDARRRAPRADARATRGREASRTRARRGGGPTRRGRTRRRNAPRAIVDYSRRRVRAAGLRLPRVPLNRARPCESRAPSRSRSSVLVLPAASLVRLVRKVRAARRSRACSLAKRAVDRSGSRGGRLRARPASARARARARGRASARLL